MSDTVYRRVVIGALVALSLLVLLVTAQRNGAEKARDQARTANTQLVREILDACVVRPDGSLDSCRPGTIIATTTTAVLP